MQAEELRERIASFPRWHYRFEFQGGIETPMPDHGMINRHEQRRRYFFEPAAEFGWAAVPRALNMTDYSGLTDYERGRRLAFICSPSTPLSGLPVEQRPPRLPWWLKTLVPRRRPGAG
jgi:hypothetical protein